MGKIIVLGSTGYIGSKLLPYLKSKCSSKVLTAGRSSCDIHVDLSKDYNGLLENSLSGDCVIFLAAISSPAVCIEESEFAQLVNVNNTLKLIEALTRKGVKVVFSSTDMVFGKYEKEVFDDSDLLPFGQYGDLKAEVERKVENNELVKVIRLSYVLGPGDKYTNMLFDAANSGETVEVFSGFDRNVVALPDVLEGIKQLITRWDEIDASCINFSGPVNISRYDVTKLFSELLCPTLSYQLVEAPERFWDSRPKSIVMNSKEFPNLLGYTPQNIEDFISEWVSYE